MPDRRSPVRVLVVGAGPAGLAVSKCLDDLHINHHLVDRHGQPGGAYQRIYSRMPLSSPSNYLGLPGAAPPRGSGYLLASEFAQYLRIYADANGISIIRRTVSKVQASFRGLEIKFEDSWEAHLYESVVA
jgi:putative flavoprotein involved in K+ transport